MTESAVLDSEAPVVKPMISFQVPDELKDLVESKAQEDGKSVAQYVRAMLADYLNYELPPMERVRARKYFGTPEEVKDQRAQAAKDARDQKNNALKVVIEMVKSGKLELAPETRALLGL